MEEGLSRPSGLRHAVTLVRSRGARLAAVRSGSVEDREQLRNRVTAAIREQLTSGAFKPGDVVRLGPLAKALGISVTPVREALLLLTQDGWLTHEPNRGFRVVPIRRSDIEDTYFMWATAEGEIAARAAPRATARDVAQLRRLDERINEADASDGRLHIELNRALHYAIYVVSDARKLRWFSDAASRLVPFHLSSSFHEVPEWVHINRTAHGPIIDAIAAGNQEEARRLMAAHIRATGDLLLNRIDALGLWAEPDTYEDATGPAAPWGWEPSPYSF